MAVRYVNGEKCSRSNGCAFDVMLLFDDIRQVRYEGGDMGCL